MQIQIFCAGLLLFQWRPFLKNHALRCRRSSKLEDEIWMTLTFASLQAVCLEEYETSASRCEQDSNDRVLHPNIPRSKDQMFFHKQPGCCDPKYYSGPAGGNCLKIFLSDSNSMISDVFFGKYFCVFCYKMMAGFILFVPSIKGQTAGPNIVRPE